jgi:hypothetical protein
MVLQLRFLVVDQNKSFSDNDRHILYVGQKSCNRIAEVEAVIEILK